MPQPAILNDVLPVTEIFSSIQGEGMLAGRRQIFIRLAGCNLDCLYCDTDFADSGRCRVETEPGSGVFEEHSSPIRFDTLAALVRDWMSLLPGAHHSISVTGGEPLLHADALARFIPGVRVFLPVHLETNGTMSDALNLLVRELDYISMDIKLPSVAGTSSDLWERHEEFLRVAAGVDLSVKVVVGAETTSEEMVNVCELLARGADTPALFLQPVSLPDGGCAISAAQLLRLQAVVAVRYPELLVIPQMHRMMGAL